MEAFRLVERVALRLADERGDGDGRVRGREEILDRATEPDERSDEDGKGDREEPIAVERGAPTLPTRGFRGLGVVVLDGAQASASSAASSNSTLL
jgi:hypothetical protein